MRSAINASCCGRYSRCPPERGRLLWNWRSFGVCELQVWTRGGDEGGMEKRHRLRPGVADGMHEPNLLEHHEAGPRHDFFAGEPAPTQWCQLG